MDGVESVRLDHIGVEPNSNCSDAYQSFFGYDSLERERRVIEHLLKERMCDIAQLQRAQSVTKRTGLRFDTVLTQIGLITELKRAALFADLLNIRITAPADYPPSPILRAELPTAFLRRVGAIPIRLESESAIVTFLDPLDNYACRVISAKLRLPVLAEVAIPKEFEAAFRVLYPDNSGQTSYESYVRISKDGEEDAERLQDISSEAPIIKLVNNVVSEAVECNASDIHLETFEGRCRVRYRIDGDLRDVASFESDQAVAIISRLKIMAKLDIAETRLPQDGRLKIAVRGAETNFRMSTVRSLHGEKVVLRILNRGQVKLQFSTLGFQKRLVDRWDEILRRPNGIVLVSGPTGSGKTTSLYASLSALNSQARNVITIEDPIEIQLDGITQVPIKPQLNLDFARLLRSVLRQDPDIIMVGEIRDLETLEVAVHAALTGHLVLTTIHTNSAAATITRLRDMGLEDYLISSVLRGILAQRLVRRLCASCRREVEVTDQYSDIPTGFQMSRDRYQSQGCADCHQTGFSGREAVGELLVVSPTIEHLIANHADERVIERQAVAEGMVVMAESGFEAVRAGRTNAKEILQKVGTPSDPSWV